MAWNSVQTEGIVNGWNINKKAEELQKELKKEDGSTTATASGNNIKVANYKGYNAVINTTDGSFTSFAKSNEDGGDEDTLKIELTIVGTTVNDTTPPNPDSSIFEHVSGTTIDTGYIIKDKNNGNEFVWVPVEANQKIQLKVKSTNEDITGIKLYDPEGNEINIGSVSGKSYNNLNITPTTNGIYQVEVMTANVTESKKLTVRSLYAQDRFSEKSGKEELDEYDQKLTEALNKYTDEYITSDEGIAEAKGYYGNPKDVATLYQRMGVTTEEQYIAAFRQRHVVTESSIESSKNSIKNYFKTGKFTDTTNYVNSVNANGGFYIARYEAGATTVRTSANKNDSADTIKTANGVPTSKANQTPYNNITQSQAKGLAESMYTGTSFTCTLPTGATWDRILGWLVNTNNKSLSNLSRCDSSWGNTRDNDNSFSISPTAQYSNDRGNTYTAVNDSYTKPGGTSVLLTTGAAPTRNVSNNIFDLTGNVGELTTEVFNEYPVYRGQNFLSSGLYPIERVHGDETFASYGFGIGFRSAIYL